MLLHMEYADLVVGANAFITSEAAPQTARSSYSTV